MKIKLRESFQSRLLRQLEYISRDNPTAARKFKNDVLNAINSLPQRAWACRKSIYFDDEQIRDLIFKGYTIVFRISENTIDVFGFVKYQQNPTDES
ncbi:ParE toxin of type II toxin-antitoxin system, parDE [Cyclonatronum proteinivorum]|uniref:ParE toxin of type II toxin-antitoxin system, parDE n=1 Tax=Cyclonatronum proteinivorum TaxID=1457365 RepID=A0A345UFT5_9BACT|nr:type II toxin-antitoxin system RelE/ParE family toxin [Cyclonatronum proteinivorum]AXI99336.1 ParE toxin of type II toxin-antitoxin system, parDE [Cyclonatronum proteinivorum]